jgi:hypothetical protein
MDLAGGVIWQQSVEFRPGLLERNFSFRFQDLHQANQTSSAALTDLDYNRVYANTDNQSNSFGNSLAFNESTTPQQFAQIAGYRFTSFSTPVTTPQSQPVPDGDPAPFTVLPPGNGAINVDLPDGTTEGEFSALYKQAPLGEVLSGGIDDFTAIDFIVPGGVFQYWNLDFTGTYDPNVGASVTFTYDDRLLAPGTDETRLLIYHHTHGAWFPTFGIVDPVNNTITVSGIEHFSSWGLGQAAPLAAVPEPASMLIWLAGAFGGVFLTCRRNRLLSAR